MRRRHAGRRWWERWRRSCRTAGDSPRAARRSWPCCRHRSCRSGGRAPAPRSDVPRSRRSPPPPTPRPPPPSAASVGRRFNPPPGRHRRRQEDAIAPDHGVEWPRPGISTFHATFDVSLHCVGASPGATPVCWMPRQCGHHPAGVSRTRRLCGKKGRNRHRDERSDKWTTHSVGPLIFGIRDSGSGIRLVPP